MFPQTGKHNNDDKKWYPNACWDNKEHHIKSIWKKKKNILIFIFLYIYMV